MFLRSAVVSLALLVLTLFAINPVAAHDSEEGTVVKAGEGKLILTAKGQEKQLTREVAKEATITLNGKAAKLEDLKPGIHVKLSLGAKHVVTKIEAVSKNSRHTPDADGRQRE